MSRYISAVLATGAAAMAVAACGGDSSSETPAQAGGSGAQKLTTLTVEFPAQISVAPVQWAIDRGLFAKAGLKLKLLPWTSPSTLPTLVNGQANIAYSGGGAMVAWASQGVPLSVLASTQLEGDSIDDVTSGIIVGGDSSIRGFRDLEGKTVAITGLKGSSQGFAERNIRNAGGDPKKTKFVTVPFEGMPAALRTGKVDATVAAQPYLAQEMAAGGRFVGPLFPSGYTNYFFTTQAYAKSHHDVLAKFIGVLEQADDYANAHYAEIRDVYAKAQKLPPEAVKSLPKTIKYQATVDPAALNVDLETMNASGYLGTNKVDPSALVFK